MRDDDKIHYRPAPTSADDRKDDGSSTGELTDRVERPTPPGRLRHRLARRPGWGRSRRTTVAAVSAVACCLGLVTVVQLRATDDGPDNAASTELLRRVEQDSASRGLARTPSTPPTTAPVTPAPSASTAAPTKAPTKAPEKKSTAPSRKPVARKTADVAPVAGLTVAQMNNAKAIVRTGRAMGVPRRALVIAVATAMQESTLRNLASGALPESQSLPHQGLGWDHDSVGLFQQRASMGWGTVQQLMDPAYATRKFLTTLLGIPGWQQMRLSEAAQAVQVSAFPDAYARHEPTATVVVDAIVGPIT